MMVIASRYAVTRAHKKRFYETGTHGPKGASLQFGVSGSVIVIMKGLSQRKVAVSASVMKVHDYDTYKG